MTSPSQPALQNVDSIPSGKDYLLYLLKTSFDASLCQLEQRTDEHMLSLSCTAKSFEEFTASLDKMTQETEETLQQRRDEEERERKRKEEEEEERKRKEEEEKKKKEEVKSRASKSVGKDSRPSTSNKNNRSISSLTTPAKRGKSTKKETTKTAGTSSMPTKNEKTKSTTPGRISSFKAEEEANNRKKALSKSKTDHNITKKETKGRHTIGVSNTKKGGTTKKKTVKENIKNLNIKTEGNDNNDNSNNKVSKTEPSEVKDEDNNNSKGDINNDNNNNTQQENEIPKEEEKVIEIPRNPPEYYINTYINEKWFDNIFAYLPIKDRLSFVSTSKLFKQHYLTILNSLETSITDTLNLTEGQTLENKIKDLKASTPSPSDPAHPYPEFQVTKGALKAIELCNGESYNKLFKKTVLEPKLMDIIVIYRILLRLIRANGIADIEDDAEFWVKCCEFLNEKCPDNKVGTFIIESAKNLDFDDHTVYKINKLITQKKAKIVPAVYSKICSTTGLLVFFIKDSLEYCGIIVSDKKTPPIRIVNNLVYIQKLLDKMNKMKEYVGGF